MPTGLCPSAIASVHLRRQVAGGDGSRIEDIVLPKFAFLLGLLALVLMPLRVSALLITNTASVTSNLGQASASAYVNTPTRTPSTVELLQYTPGTTPIAVPDTTFSIDGTSGGGFAGTGPITGINRNPVSIPGPVDLQPALAYKGGEPIFIRLTDLDQNLDPLGSETVVVTLTSTGTGDSVLLRLNESAPNSGIFVGVIQSSTEPAVLHDRLLSVTIDDLLRVDYVDAFDALNDQCFCSVKVDPFGLVFSTADGSPQSGAIVTLWDVGGPVPVLADVLADDGVTPFPATVTSGDSALGFPTGGYRFPFISPGTYRLEVTPPTGFTAPSTVATPVIQGLPGNPFAIVAGSRNEDFLVSPGPAMQIDIPLDSLAGGLFISKKSMKPQVSRGEFNQYSVTITNSSLGSLAGLTVTDMLPAGFRYQAGSATLGGVTVADPAISADGRTLNFILGTLAAGSSAELRYVTGVSAGARPGIAVNTARATAGPIHSNIARAQVRVVEDLGDQRSHLVGRVLLGTCEKLPAGMGSAGLRLTSRNLGDQIEYRAGIEVTAVPLADLSLRVELPEVLEYTPGSARLGEKALGDPVVRERQLHFVLGSAPAGSELILTFQARPRLFTFGEFSTRAYLEFRDPEAETLEGSPLLRSPLATNRVKDFSRTIRPRFDTLKAELKDEDRRELDLFIADLQGQKIGKLNIVGHADERPIRGRSQNIFSDNKALSQARAEAVRNYLRQRLGLNDDQITINAMGTRQQVIYGELLTGTSLSRAEQLAKNRRVEVFVELQGREGSFSRFLVTKGDSGEKKINTRDLSPGSSTAEIGLDTPGIEGVRLFMEDGRFVDTDAKGLYHFEGLEPGSHVVQVDLDSLPQGLEIYQCEENTRFAGVPHSRFADLQGGTLWRSDFFVRRQDPESIRGDLTLRMASRIKDDSVLYTLNLKGEQLNLLNRTLAVELPDGFVYRSGSAELNGRPLQDPAGDEQTLSFILDPPNGENWQENLTFAAAMQTAYEGDHTSTAFLQYQTLSGKKLATLPVGTTLTSQTDSATRLVFGANFPGTATALAEPDRQRLDGVIDFLRGRNIQYVQLHYLPLNQTAELPGPEENPARQRIELVAQRLTSALGLHPQQLLISGLEREQLSAAGRIELSVNLPDERKVMGLREKVADSGPLRQEIVTLLPPKVEEPPSQGESVAGVKEPGIISLQDGQPVATRIQAIQILLDTPLTPELLVDGKPVPRERIGFTKPIGDQGCKLYTYIGVDLGERGEHRLALHGIGPFGNVRFRQELSYFRTGEIAAIRVLDTSGNTADGKTPVQVRVQLLDETGEPIDILTELVVKGGDLRPYKDELNNLPELRQSVRTVTVGADGIIRFQPVGSSGSHSATLAHGDLTVEIQTYVGPAYREWIMVGLAEGTMAYNSLSGNMRNLTEADIEDGYYDDGRLAFYTKGKVLGQHLLTMAFDSSKEKKPTDNGLFGAIDPNRYYTLYGDNTQVRYDAASGEKLYLKLESDQYYLLFGDYNTGLTVTELSRYSRSLTGLKAEYHSERVRITAFGAEADQAFVRDELRGDGTSGLYHLSRLDIVPNSEKITLETRDRFHSEVVLESRPLVRFTDYTFDPLDGTIYFREPIYSRDAAFNPVYIVAEYETVSGNSGDLIGGGRAAMRLGDSGPEIGASLVHEGVSGAEATLAGADFKWQLGRATLLQAEMAGSDNKSGGTGRSGEALLAEISHQDKKLESRAYFRRQNGGFGLGQQKSSEDATRKYGLDGRYRLSEQLSAGGEMFRQENLDAGGRRDVLAGLLQYRFKPWTASLGARFARDEDQNGASRESTLLTGGGTRSFLTERLELYTRAELAVGRDANPDYPTRLILGTEYKLTPAATLFAAQETTWGENQDSETSRVGIKGTPWREASFTSSIEDQTSEYGPRTFANLGLTQGLPIDQHLRLDFGLERTETLRHPGNVPANANVPPASGSARDDFTAVSAGATYKEELWSGISRGEYRDGEFEDKAALLLGFYREQSPGFGLSSVLRHFDTTRTNGTRNTRSELEFSIAHRPLDSPWIILDKARLSGQWDYGPTSTVRSNKLVNNLNANRLFDRRNQLALAHGIKYVLDSFDGAEYDGFTQLVGIEYRHDFTPGWDLGVKTAAHFTDVGRGAVYSTGIAVGHSFAKNVWLSLGYNFIGFRDDDFTAADYTAQGVYLKCRAKFDQFTARQLLAWWEK